MSDKGRLKTPRKTPRLALGTPHIPRNPPPPRSATPHTARGSRRRAFL